MNFTIDYRNSPRSIDASVETYRTSGRSRLFYRQLSRIETCPGGGALPVLSPKKGTWGEDGVILSLEPLFRFFPPPFRCHPFDSMIVTRALRPFLSPLSPKGELRSCHSAGSPIFVDRIISSVMNAGTIGGWCNRFD